MFSKEIRQNPFTNKHSAAAGKGNGQQRSSPVSQQDRNDQRKCAADHIRGNKVNIAQILKDFKNTRAGAREETETADGAAVRSMPDAGQAGGTVQQGNNARFDLSDLNDCQYCLENIVKGSIVQFFKAGESLFFRPYVESFR